MKKITEKDRQGMARSLQVFMSCVNGKRTQVKSLLEATDRAIDQGLSIDELLNTENYSRAQSITPSPDAMEYITIMAERQIQVRKLTEEEGWDDPEGFSMIAQAFHAFYKEISPKGGTWSTPNAKIKLARAIRRHSLQAIMSEKLILEIMEKNPDGKDLTCFNYIDEILNSPEKYDIDESLTQEQHTRIDLENEIEEPVVEEPPVLETEGKETDNDSSIYETLEDSSVFFTEEFDPNDMEEVSSFISYKDPQEYKRGCITAILNGLSFVELNALKDAVEDEVYECNTIEDFIWALTDCKLNRNLESEDARSAHQYFQTELAEPFISCLQLQGIDINEDNVSNYDILLTNWDMRDIKTRKLQKLKQLIYDNADDDQDLIDAIKDIENLYQ